jgi:hypothetical protein
MPRTVLLDQRVRFISPILLHNRLIDGPAHAVPVPFIPSRRSSMDPSSPSIMDTAAR